jgi:hypothetical protein
MLLIALPGFWHQINFAVKFSFNHERKVPKTRVNKDRRDQKTAGLNFINILCTAFTPADPKSVKRIDDLTVFFTLSGSTGVKAEQRKLVKLTPDTYEKNRYSKALKI